MAASDHLAIARDDGVTTVTLNRPESLNAIDPDLHRTLEKTFVDLQEDESTRAVVLTGAGRAFCAGGDIRAMQTGGFSGRPRNASGRGARRLIENLLDLEKPVIAAVNGDAIGLGATLALFCDVVIAARKARFGDTHVRVGLVAGDGGAVIWPLLVGVARAKEYLMTGTLLSATEAERIGLINRVVDDDQALPAATELARKLADGPALAISWTKMAINKQIKANLNLVIDASLAWEHHTFHSADHQEAVNAFLEKRRPHFQGR